MTGIADVFKHRQQAARLRLAHARELLLQALPPRLALWLRPHLGALSTRHLLCPQPLLPDPRPTLEYNAGALLTPAGRHRVYSGLRNVVENIAMCIVAAS